MKKLSSKIFTYILCLVLLVSGMSFSVSCGHKHVAGDIVKENVTPATCTENGSYTEVVYCKDCGEEMSKSLKVEDALGHMPGTPVAENRKGYPCVDGSYTFDEVINCSDCGVEMSRTQKTVEGNDHTPAAEVKENEQAATCIALGGYDIVVYCEAEGCKEELSREHHDIAKTAHSFDADTWANDKTGHWHACKTTGCTEQSGFAEHTPGAPATATTSQLCTVCEYVLASPIGHVHESSLTHVAAKDATCTEDGNDEYYACTCGNWYEDDKAQKLIDNHASAVRKATGHSFATGWTSDDNTHWHAATCEHASEKGDEAEHVFDGGVYDSESGKRTYTCTECKKPKQVNAYAVTLEYNFDGAPAAYTVVFDDGAVFKKPSGFGRENYRISGWYTDAACTNAYDTSAAISSDLRLYPKWEQVATAPKEYVIEGEYIDLTGIKGVGYSNQTQGTGLIQKDEDSYASDGSLTQKKAGASNGYYLGYLYKRGLTLTFVVNSDKATDNATIKLALGAEFLSSITLTDAEFIVSVNDEAMKFDTMVITGNDGLGYPSKFEDFTVGVGVNLKEGENIITLRVNNSKTMVAAMLATAPLIDCMKIYSDTVITYTPKTSNLNKFND